MGLKNLNCSITVFAFDCRAVFARITINPKLVHLVEELKEKLTDFRFSLILFNDVQESVFTLDEWKADWTLAQVYDVSLQIMQIFVRLSLKASNLSSFKFV